MLGARRVLVVHGVDGLDEITVGGRTDVTEAAGGRLREFSWLPSDFGLATSGKTAMLVEDSRQSAALIRQVLAGAPGPARDVVGANAAGALWTAGAAASLAQCRQSSRGNRQWGGRDFWPGSWSGRIAAPDHSPSTEALPARLPCAIRTGVP